MRVFLRALFALGLAIVGYWAALTAQIYFQLAKFGIASQGWVLLRQNCAWAFALLFGLTLMGASLSLLLRRPGISTRTRIKIAE